ncbi:mechanosensitive ion channel family protein [Xanthomonas sp. NCPPB 2654]|uniref:mechanosensitive ion channel family protein n=1 Tax=unclassified Xanthomonas TaxID=2643310 RepID=UPI0021DFDEC7|nr:MULTISPECIES: mechanosensitive ion channel family protein [unclassified Xanthomonas]MDL5367988.1 mechanosensitive ion channel family protein [Xanthomonas sp. NCPPB 2654]MEB1530855.1 mechanosensitive ion channel family protein [Xanthomonas campestris pv. campestris]UYC22820.1 mechanosensitive ion channel family protein [Xanthomonas sp. CFBP 8443]
MDLDWIPWRAYTLPIGAAVVLGFLAWWLLLRIAQRMRGRDYRRARIIGVISVPMAFLLPMLMLSFALESTPLDDRALADLQHLLHIGMIGCVTWLLVRGVAALERAILRSYPIEVADNLTARRVQTQTRVLARVAMGTIILLGTSVVLLTFPAVRQIGTTLLASAGIIGLVAGIAAKPVFGNLIAGLQIALTQPIRLDDVVIVEGEWGRIEEIGSSYVVVRIWDERRMVVPLTWFIENPFQNWTRSSANLLGTAFLWLDYRTPMAQLRAELERICKSEPLWDGRVCVTQVTETSESTIQVRLLVSARNSGDAFDLRCIVRERMIDFLTREHPYALPTLRAQIASEPARAPRTPAVPSDSAAMRSPGAEDGAPAATVAPDAGEQKPDTA